MSNEMNAQVPAQLAPKNVSRVQFFTIYQDLLEEKGVDENGKPVATLKDLSERFPTLEPITVKQKLYSVLNKVNSDGHNYPMLPSGEPRKKRTSNKATVDAQLLELARTRRVFNSVD
jgi:molybdopterin converting factor small subunit